MNSVIKFCRLNNISFVYVNCCRCTSSFPAGQIEQKTARRPLQFPTSSSPHPDPTTTALIRTYKSGTTAGVKTYPKRLQGNLKTMQLESVIFKEIFTPELTLLVDLFTKYGYEIRMAGGAVRDLLMGKQPADIDFATTATPDEMKEMFEQENIRMINAKGEQHGTVTARINDKENFEVTTLRIDVVTDGRRAEVEFTKNWELDAGRRDLTVNSMFLGFDGTVYDYFNGAEDLEQRRVKFVGNPNDRIREDYLRILRYFRFYGRISLEADKHDEATIQAVRENVNGLQQISGERLWTELKKILQGNYSHNLVLKMLDLGIGPYIGLPKSPNTVEFTALGGRVEKLETKLHSVTHLSSLLRDETEALNLHARLRLSSYERDLCLFLILHRNKEPDDNPLRYYQAILICSKNKTKDVRIWIEETLKYDGELGLLQQFQDWDPPKFPIRGHKLMEMNVPKKSMTLVLNYLRDLWIDSGFTMTEEELNSQIPNAVMKFDISPKAK